MCLESFVMEVQGSSVVLSLFLTHGTKPQTPAINTLERRCPRSQKPYRTLQAEIHRSVEIENTVIEARGK